MFRPALLKSLLFCALIAGVHGAQAATSLEKLRQHNREIYARTLKSVVGIEATTPDAVHTGSGIIVTRGGLVLTTAEVVPEGAASITVTFADGRRFDAVIEATDAATSARLLCIEGMSDASCTPLELADSLHAHIGDDVYTSANAFETIRDGQVGFSAGHISGIYAPAGESAECGYHGTVIETDAAVNPGSEGGALLDRDGRVLGLLSMSLDASRRLGVAIPMQPIRAAFARELQIDDRAAQTVQRPNTALRNWLSSLTCSTLRFRQSFGFTEWSSSQQLTANSFSVRRALARVIRPGCATSGVVLDPCGLILTCAAGCRGGHVQVELYDKRVLDAALLGEDTDLDIALLKVESPERSLPSLPLCSACSCVEGAEIAAFGFSCGGSTACNCGMVSAGKRYCGTACQTDLKVNAGNYGGPVVDAQGRLIGIVSHFCTDNDFSQPNCGVGFYTPAAKIAAYFGAALLKFPGAVSVSRTADAQQRAAPEDCTQWIDRVKRSTALIGDGSGVVVSRDGYMLTCVHVAGAQAVWPVRIGEHEYTADVIENDASADLCLLKIRGVDNLDFAPLARAEAVQIGDPVLCAGDPFKLAGDTGITAFSRGIISGLHRNQGRCRDVIQTDAAINPGSSGGPLFTCDGEVLGISATIRCRFEAVANTGIGFAVSPGKMARIAAAVAAGAQTDLKNVSYAK